MKGEKKYGWKFGNCVECDAYQLIDRDGLCKSCVDEESNLIDHACRFLQKNPNATREDVAEALLVKVSRVNRWMRQRRIQCVAMRSVCPECGEELINKFECKCQKIKTRDRYSENRTSKRVVYLDYLKRRKKNETKHERFARRKVYASLFF